MSTVTESAEHRLARLTADLRALHAGATLTAPPIDSPATRALLAGRRISEGIAAARRAEFEAGRRTLEDALDRMLDNAPAALPTPATPPRSLWDSPLEADRYWSPVPVLGFRAWEVGDRLHGAKRPWQSHTYEAGCILRNKERFDEAVPHTDGSCGRPPCGVYATKKAWSLLDECFDPTLAFGIVEMSGKVVEHDFGYRARRATAVFMVLEHQGQVVTAADPGEVARLFADPAAYLASHQSTGVPWNSAEVERRLLTAAKERERARSGGPG
ncbi:MAG: hypothetical protein WD184_03020 [Acidimicrobiia bacterium]